MGEIRSRSRIAASRFAPPAALPPSSGASQPYGRLAGACLLRPRLDRIRIAVLVTAHGVLGGLLRALRG